MRPRAASGQWVSPARRAASFDQEGRPQFLNQLGKVDTPGDWNSPAMPRLWLYNLNYFDDLNASGATERSDFHGRLIVRWINENPPFEGTGWEPYPCSLRIVNWIKWALGGNELQQDQLGSLALQSAWLEKHIEWHLLGNHLFANAKALVFAGLFFEGREARRWLRKGLEILERELPEQILGDGGQFELSPMYHAIASEDILDLLNAAQAWPEVIDLQTAERWKTIARKMLEWASVMRHPDGRIALFNDSAFGIAPELDEIFSYSKRLGIEFEPPSAALEHLKQSGYVRAALGDAALFADVGRIGPDYLPGHAHADTLGFELSLHGKRCFVDSGCSTYEVCDERLRQRGTAAHNTVIVDGEDSSEVWRSFRVARRARPFSVGTEAGSDAVAISAAHDGYKRLKGKVIHKRSFRLKYGELVISDKLDGSFNSAEANFLLHPGMEVRASDRSVILTRNGQEAEMQFDSGQFGVHPATWHPEFGLSIPTHRVTVAFTRNMLTTTIHWGD